jgi:uncharacterized protein YebE (UPF0316 family)
MWEEFDYYNWVVFPTLIFFARVCDVSLGTLRGVLAAKGYKSLVPIIGFFEVLIWLAAISRIFQNLNDNLLYYLAWAAGYSTGSYIGLVLEEKLALGLQVVRIITNQSCENLITAINNENFGLTIVDGQGTRGPVKLLFSTVKRKDVKRLVELINRHTPNSFYSIEDIKNASQVSFNNGQGDQNFFKRLLPIRKGK